MMILSARQVAMAVSLVMVAGACVAQTAPAAKPAPKPSAAKPAAKPAEKPDAKAEATTSLSGKDVGGKLLTREELRACLKQRDELQVRVTKAEVDRSAMDKERAAIQADQDQLKADNQAAGGLRPLIEELTAKNTQFAADNTALTKRVAAFNENKELSRTEAAREREGINAAIESLKSREKLLQAERESLVARTEAHNKSIIARDDELKARIADWNARNRKLNSDSETLSDERSTWTTECGNRRYREEDEKAIASGK